MEFNRRKFILTSALGIGGLALSTSAFGQFNALTSIGAPTNLTIMQLLRSAALKRRSKLYAEATQIYNSVISIDSNEIRAYDGIRKILLADKFKEIEVLNLYVGGFYANPSNPFFKQRIAKEYMRLALGNKKYKDQLNYPDDLLEKAKTFLEQAKIEVPNDEQMQKLFEKADRKLSFNANLVDARTNSAIKNYKKDNHQNYKNRFSELTEIEVKDKLDLLLNKSSNDYRDVHVREIYRVYIKKLKENQKFDLASQLTKELYLFDKKDSHSLKIARSICKKDQKYDVLEVIERKNDAIKKSFWSKIALFDVLYKRKKIEGIGSISEMKNILSVAASKKFSFYHFFEYKTRQIRIALIQNKTTEARNLLNEFADTLIGTSSAHFINKFNMLCVEYFMKLDNKKYALIVFDIALKENEVKLSDLFLEKIVKVNVEKENDKSIHNIRLQNYKRNLLNS